MKLNSLVLGLATAIAIMAGAHATFAADGNVVIGDIDGLSGNYADYSGSGSAEAAKMAIADFA